MVSALTGEIPIVMLTGDEGSGKTVLCRLLVERMSSAYATVYFPQTADSFEDVLKSIVQELGLAITPVPKDRTGLLQGIVSHLHDHNLRVVLFFDEAERIYLATLERVRKMLDLANVDGIFIQMVMSGRSGLHNNFRNLALVNFQPAEERHFSLEPLTEDETYEYLTFAMLEAVPEKRSFFSREAAAAIFASSRGNLRTINRLADELLHGDEGRDQLSPVVDNGLEKKIQQKRPRRRLKRPVVAMPKITLNWRYLIWGGSAACIVLAFLLFWPKEKTVGPQVAAVPDTETSIVISQPKEMARIEPDVETIEQKDQENPEAKDTSAGQTGGKIQRQQEPDSAPAPTGVQPAVVSIPQQPQPPAVEAQPEAEEKHQPIGQQTVPASETGETENAAVSAPIEPVVVSIPRQPQTPVAASESETEEKKPLAAPTHDVLERMVEKEKEPPPLSTEDKRRPQTAVEAVVEEPATVEPASQIQSTGRKVAVVAETSRPVAATEDAPIIPQTIKARAVSKNREDLTPAVRETIASERIKILKQEEPDAFEMPAAPVTIRAVEQKKESELATRPAPSTDQNPQVTEPEEVAVLVSEKPRKTESVDKIYSSRVAAGASWLSGLKDDRYTVRLMVITSGDAEKKLKSMLGEKKYREQADKFYILRRESNPGVQYVYYGEYPTMTAARNARNTIPEFLRDYKPYAMSVKGAVQRAQQEE